MSGITAEQYLALASEAIDKGTREMLYGKLIVEKVAYEFPAMTGAEFHAAMEKGGLKTAAMELAVEFWTRAKGGKK